MAMHPLKTLNFFLLVVVAVALATPAVTVSLNELSSLDYQLKELHQIPFEEPTEQTCKVTPKGASQLHNLLEDFKNYTIPYDQVMLPNRTKIPFEQEGTLYEHTMWTAHALENWFVEEEKNYWVKNIDPKDKNLTILAGLLHGIWHAGLKKQNKKYPEDAFSYLLGLTEHGNRNWTGIPRYKTENERVLPALASLQKKFKISKSDWSIIAITAALCPLFETAIQGTLELTTVTKTKQFYDQAFRDNWEQPAVAGKRFADICIAVAAAHALATREVLLGKEGGAFGFSTIKSPAAEKPTIVSLYELLMYDSQAEQSKSERIRDALSSES